LRVHNYVIALVYSYVIALATCRNSCVLYLQNILAVIFILRVNSYVIALASCRNICVLYLKHILTVIFILRVHSYVIALAHSYVIALASCRNICVLYLKHIFTAMKKIIMAKPVHRKSRRNKDFTVFLDWLTTYLCHPNKMMLFHFCYYYLIL
jgi:hypothetical protein